jgi:predicted nucleic acid-binding protein
MEVMAAPLTSAHANGAAPLISLTSHRILQSEALLRQYKLKLPDAIILATAQLHRLELITRNTNFAGFLRSPYESP